MGIASTFTFTDLNETVTRDKLNNLVANLLTEFNGNIENANVAANAAIAASKLNLATVAQNVDFTGNFLIDSAAALGSLLLGTGTSFNNLTIGAANRILGSNGTTASWRQIAASDIGTLSTVDIDGGTIDGVTLGGNAAVTITAADMNGSTIDGTIIGGASPAAGTFTDLSSNNLQLQEGSAPSTSATEGALYVDASNDLYYRPQSDGTAVKIVDSSDGAVVAGSGNIIYTWTGAEGDTSSDDNLFISEAGFPADGSSNVNSAVVGYITDNTSALEIMVSRFTKDAGVNTVTIHARVKNTDSADSATVTVDIGGQSNTVTKVGTSFGWATTSTIDVSSLTNGQVYDISISLHSSDVNELAILTGIVLTAS